MSKAPPVHRMIVVDTSALISLAMINQLSPFLNTFDVHTTATVINELQDTSTIDDPSGRAARKALGHKETLAVHTIKRTLTSSRIDEGEGSCVLLTRQKQAKFLITDDIRALPELQQLTEATVAISPIVLKAMVKLNMLKKQEAKQLVEELTETRNWLGAPIYHRAQV